MAAPAVVRARDEPKYNNRSRAAVTRVPLYFLIEKNYTLQNLCPFMIFGIYYCNTIQTGFM